ncbi:MAG TPA: hypothetical protein VEK08_22465 [Planctomycetota bacterium]|nr:hypothetical protein [Planctomycetota bacterium]
MSLIRRVIGMAALACTLAHAAETVKCPAKADVSLSSAVTAEKDSNGGKSERMKLKIYQEFGIIDFDVAKLKGKTIQSATLHVAPAGGARYSPERGTDLRWFTLSTVSSPWVEGEGTSYARDEKGHGATFNEASYKTRPWAFPGSKVWDVAFGNGNTLRCDSDGGDPKDGYFTIPVDVKLVQALIGGTSHGFLIMDGSTGVDRNCTIYTRESKKPPYLIVTFAGDDMTAPQPPSDISLTPSLSDASPTHGAGVLSFTVPQDAFAFVIKLNGQELPRWQTPFAAKAGTKQTTVLEFLQPDSEFKIEMAAMDAAGNLSAFAVGSGKSSAKASVPALPPSEWNPQGGNAPEIAGKLKAWAYPEVSKLDPLSGKIILEEGAENAASKNSVWDAASATVRIAAARGEIASFNLALEAAEPIDDLKIEISGLDGIQTKLWRTWFVKIKNQWQAEYAIPLKDGTLAIPAADNNIKDQKAAAVAVDLIVPESATAGEKSATLTISGAGGKVALNLKLVIYSAVIPKEINFNPELNAYGGPGVAGSEFFFDSFRIAHYNRSTINRVPYSQNGNIHKDWVPSVGSDGRVTDWSNFDKNLGPLLDGSAFKDNPRAGVPVPVLYLPMFEHWPLPFLKHYDPGVKATGKEWKAIHDIKAKPIEESLSKSYAEAFANVSEDFAKHANEKGWLRTQLQCFQNNKHQYCKNGPEGTAWMMDEPNEYLDWRALNYYSALFHQGVKRAWSVDFEGMKLPRENAGVWPQLVYRADVSRPMWQGNVSDGLMELTVVPAGVAFEMPYLLREHKRRMPTKLVGYGGANANDRANLESTAWCVKCYVYECDGALPWQGLGGDDAFDKGDNPDYGNALVVDARKRFGINAVASFRVHAFRQGAQICELLRLLEKKNGWGRQHSGLLVSQLIPMSTEFKQAFTDDAAAVTFKSLNGDAFVKLKEGLLKLLAK